MATPHARCGRHLRSEHRLDIERRQKTAATAWNYLATRSVGLWRCQHWGAGADGEGRGRGSGPRTTRSGVKMSSPRRQVLVGRPLVAANFHAFR